MSLNRSISMRVFTHDCCAAKTYMCEMHYSSSMKCRWSTLPLFSTQLVQYLMSSRIMSCTLSDLPVLLTLTVSLNLSQFANHGRQTVNIMSWDHQRQIFYASSPREVALSPREIFVSVFLLDSGWPNLSVSNESILSSKGQLASIKLNINCDTWATHRWVAIIEVQGRRILAHNKGKKEVCNTYNYGQ